MDVSDLITLKQDLESDITALLEAFKAKTGYMPSVIVDYYDINSIGQPTERIPLVKVTIEI